MKQGEFRVFAILMTAVTAPFVLRGDVTGTPTLTSGQELNISSGTVVSSGGDLQFDGTGLNFLGSAKGFQYANNQTSSYPNFTIAEAEADAPSMTQSSDPQPFVGNLILMQGNSGAFAKVLVTAVGGGSITLMFDTFPTPASGPITYILTGWVQCTINGQNDSAAFSWVVLANTSGITNPSAGQYQNPAITSFITINGVTGSRNVPLQNVTVYLNTTTGQVTFGQVPGGGIGIGLTGSQFTSNLATTLGPVNGSTTLTAGGITTTGGTPIELTGVKVPAAATSPTFQATTAPYITYVENAASNQLPGTGNAEIAQGAIFVIKGTNLGPATISIDPTPFQHTTLSNTSVAVTVGSTTVNALMYYTSSGQIAALLPSNMPTGAGSFTVTYNGQTSAAQGHAIVSNNLGVFSVDSSGSGPAIVTYADYSLVSAAKMPGCGGPYTECGAANPNDTLVLWATGLGPVSGSDASGAGLGVNMPAIPLKLYLGGVQAPIVYQGRSGCCIGEDQVVFTVPTGVPTGCAVPLIVQIGTEISNNTLIPIANGSRNCTASNPAQTSLEQSVLNATFPFNVALISLSRDQNSAGTGYQDDMSFQFSKAAAINPGSGPFFVTYTDDIASGTCLAYNNLNQNLNTPITTAPANAGTTMTIVGPSGTLHEQISPGKGQDTLSATPTFLVPGAFTISGAGGSDIGAFQGSVTIPASPTLTSPTTMSVANGVTRSNGLTVTWTGGAANGIVQISVQSATDITYTIGSSLNCFVPASAGTFTIPPYVMQTLAAGNFGGLNFMQTTPEVAITAATGLGFGEIATQGASVFLPFVLN